jgi:hypothetical protein
VNEGVLETFKLLVSHFEWTHFVHVQDGVVPAANTIDLAALEKPYHRLLAFSRYPYGRGCDVDIKTVRDIHTNASPGEGWYEIGKTLRSDSLATLAGPYRIVFNYRPERITVDQVGTSVPIDDEFVDMPALWAAKECFSDAKLNDDYDKAEAQWMQRAAQLKADAARRNATQQTRILDKMGWSHRGPMILGAGVRF